MTVTYSLDLSTARVGSLVKLLFRWRGSVYKLVWKELAIFLGLYYMVSFMYRYALNSEGRSSFEKLAMFCEQNSNYIPLTFVLGFYVSVVVNRFWTLFGLICWPDRFSLHVATFVEGDDERAHLLRRTIVRHAVASSLIALRNISTAVKKRFPTMEHLVTAGVLTKEELTIFDSIEFIAAKYWIPIQWACTLLYRTAKEGRIKSDYILYQLVRELLDFRGRVGGLIDNDWISLPLLYTQVVSLSVYAYFLTCVFGRQYLDTGKSLPGNAVDYYFPIFTTLQFLFYVGWLKVAETLLNPWGEDDDDFEVNFMINRNMRVIFMHVTEQFDRVPTLQKDIYWDKPTSEVPQTVASLGVKDMQFRGSVANVNFPLKQGLVLPQEAVDCYRRQSSHIDSKSSVLRKFSAAPTKSSASMDWLYKNGPPNVTTKRSSMVSESSQRSVSRETDNGTYLNAGFVSTVCDPDLPENSVHSLSESSVTAAPSTHLSTVCEEDDHEQDDQSSHGSHTSSVFQSQAAKTASSPEPALSAEWKKKF